MDCSVFYLAMFVPGDLALFLVIATEIVQVYISNFSAMSTNVDRLDHSDHRMIWCCLDRSYLCLYHKNTFSNIDPDLIFVHYVNIYPYQNSNQNDCIFLHDFCILFDWFKWPYSSMDLLSPVDLYLVTCYGSFLISVVDIL